jgi:hypothetical protein
MNAKDNLDKITKRPIQYWFEDGIGELITGGLFTLIGIYFVLQEFINSSLIKGLFGILSVVIIGGGTILGRVLISKLKERLVYPRTGYVGFAKRPSKRKLAITLSVVIGVAILVLMLGSSSSVFNWVPLVIGVICGGLMLYQATQTGIYRLYIEASLAFLIGATISILGKSEPLGSGLFFVIYGLIMVFAGGCALRNYFRQAPPLSNLEEARE